MRMWILGSGTPVPARNSFGSAYIIETGADKLLFDCGPATTYKMAQVGIAPTEVDWLFFTHHHFDHDIDYPCFLLSRWDQSVGRENELEVFGPTPTELLTRRLLNETDGAFAHDWIARVNHPMSLAAFESRGGTLPRRPPHVRAQDLVAGTEVSRGTWQVRTAEAQHAQPWLDSIAYRLDTDEGSVVLTGDTRPCDEVARIAAGADTLVVSCLDRQERLDRTPLGSGIAGTTAAGEMAQRAGVRRLVLVHQFHTFATPGHRERGIAEAAQRFGGEIIFGEELMSVDL